MQELKEGSTLQGGKYRIVRMLGQGGFGITYEGVQTGLDRRVAIKEFFMKEYCNRDGHDSRVSIGSQGSADMVGEFKVKFLKEAQLIARLEDAPHVVRIHDIFEENGTAYYVMEYLGSGSLNDLLKREGPLSEERAIGYVRQIGEALTFLHTHNTLHLDIKPSNVLLNKKGEAVLIDFGVSKHYDHSGSQTSSTPVGLSKGFAPTEQYQSGGVHQFTPATDVYSLGATLYNLITNQMPPEASIVFEDGLPPRPHYVSERTWNAIVAAMQPRRKDRLQTVDELLQALSDTPAPQPKPQSTPQPQPTPQPEPSPRPKPQPIPQPIPHPTPQPEPVIEDDSQQPSAETVMATSEEEEPRRGLFLELTLIGALLPLVFLIVLTFYDYLSYEGPFDYFIFDYYTFVFPWHIFNFCIVFILAGLYSHARVKLENATNVRWFDILIILAIAAVTTRVNIALFPQFETGTLLIVALAAGILCFYLWQGRSYNDKWRWCSTALLSIILLLFLYLHFEPSFFSPYLTHTVAIVIGALSAGGLCFFLQNKRSKSESEPDGIARLLHLVQALIIGSFIGILAADALYSTSNYL